MEPNEIGNTNGLDTATTICSAILQNYSLRPQKLKRGDK